MKIFFYDETKVWFEKKALKLFEKYNVFVDSFCIMDSHFHLFIKPSNDSNVSKMMQELCSSFSLHYNNKYKHIGHVFQGRFKAKEITTIQGIQNVRNYIQENPVKAGYCSKPGNYRWLWSEGLRPWGSDPR